MELFKRLPPNTAGIDFFVGDIHGHYSELMKALEAIDFKFDKDRLISVGDLIDRGEENERCIELLHEPWFHACLGNHEWMMIGAFVYEDRYDLSLQRGNGGEWLDNHDTDQLTAWAHLLQQSCPLAIEVPGKGDRLIGVTHNDVINSDWTRMESAQKGDIDECVWSRTRFASALTNPSLAEPIKNIDAVVSGHNSHTGILLAGNQLYIDTLWKSGQLTLLSAMEVLAVAARGKLPA
ncbi:metallophosphoesterase [Hahella sp. CR1]|uniref:metallophosphoesterase n=1 Tax=unclassified Hahella TaxID=2624107 RepID=UPI0021116D88|nr:MULTISPECIES: metallophosphoesterase [unclassified Hahella]MBU6952300.1 metallophosphoesterase [Hahella sp. HN01]MDG9668627.1 metallophosphoesterase [Hahella sp. CR1]